MKTRKSLNGLWTAGFVLTLIAGVGAGVSSAAGDSTSDSNRSRYGGLAVGVPYEDISGKADAGLINILHGFEDGLTESPMQWFDRHDANISGDLTVDDLFSYAMTAGDFNGDGYADLAAGAPGEPPAPLPGGVTVLYGTAGGISSAGSQWLEQGTELDELVGASEAGDQFGYALAAGDLNGDGFDDLAVGVPGEDEGTTADCGGFNVLYGSAGGLAAAGSQWFSQASDGVPEDAETLDHFGWSLAAEDFDGDGIDDLAVGAPFEIVYDGLDPNIEAGGLAVLYGTEAGLSAGGSQWFDQSTDGIDSVPNGLELFSWSLAAGDLDGDGFADLAVGVPGEILGSDPIVVGAGGVHVLYGTDDGLSAGLSQWFHRNLPMLGFANPSDEFGRALAVGDLDGDGFEDLAIGVPRADYDGLTNDGIVYVVYGTAHGLSTDDIQIWLQHETGMPPSLLGEREENDVLGSALAIGDINADGFEDMAIGVPGEGVGAAAQAGGVNLIFGSAEGLQWTNIQQWFDQSLPDVYGGEESNDKFGFSLAVWEGANEIFLPVIRR